MALINTAIPSDITELDDDTLIILDDTIAKEMAVRDCGYTPARIQEAAVVMMFELADGRSASDDYGVSFEAAKYLYENAVEIVNNIDTKETE